MSLQKFPLKSNKSPNCANWKTYNADENELNRSKLIGIMVPVGVVVFDLDLYKGVTTDQIDNFFGFGCHIDWERSMLQKTKNGGMHYAFKIYSSQDELRQGVDMFRIKGFDTRCAEKGYIATGVGYDDLTLFGLCETLENVELLPELPKSVISKLSTNEKISHDCDDLMSIVDQDDKSDLPYDDVCAYVDLLSVGQSADSDTWLKIGMALYHEFSGSDAGWLLFDKFSKKCPDKYNLEQNKSRWKSFKSANGVNPITFATVIKLVGGKKALASKAKLDLSDQINKCTDEYKLTEFIKQIAVMNLDHTNLDLLLKDIQSQYKQLCGKSPTLGSLRNDIKRLNKKERNGGFVNDYVFVTTYNEFMNRHNKTTMSHRAFNVVHDRETPFLMDGMHQAACQFASNTIECVNLDMYAPAFNDVFTREGLIYINTYSPGALVRVVKGTTDIVNRIKNHISHILIDEKEQELFINYLAHNVQFPGKKIPWAIVMQGVEGDGKSLFSEMMQHVIGYRNVRILNADTLESQFTGWADGQCLLFIEELKLDNYKKYQIVNSLKPYITNPTVECVAKGKDPKVILNTTNYIAFTNHTDSIPVGANDRRYCIMFSQWQRKSDLIKFMTANPGYYQKLYRDMRNNAGEILDWLLTHKISDDFMSYKIAPTTSSKLKMIADCVNDPSLAIEDAIAHFECDDINDKVVNVTKLAYLVRNDYDFDSYDFPKTQSIKHALVGLGYHSIGIYKNSERKNQRIYAKDHLAKAIDFK